MKLLDLIKENNKRVDVELDNIEVREIESSEGEFFNRSIDEGRDPEWIMGVQEGFTFCQNESRKIYKKSLIKILEHIVEEIEEEKIENLFDDIDEETMKHNDIIYKILSPIKQALKEYKGRLK